MSRRNVGILGAGLFLMAFLGCATNEIKAIDIYPEDMCSNCKMAFSDHRFASEIINDQSEVFKFDDIGCMLKFRSSRSGMKISATYLKDYDTKEWIPYERSTIVETDIETPMGSGKVAFADSTKAREFQKQHPPAKTLSSRDGCGMDCCDDEKD
ncbi:MAG: putative lipoprotein involved in nitrous oxide reduction [Bacteroidetes bacterium]|nr:putative lipoprotein involved in nitrous oxide reduction [Bacteroidota bacterium]